MPMLLLSAGPALGGQVERPQRPSGHAQHISSDVAVYGATPGGITAAIAAARSGARVVLVEPRTSIGGMMANGLGWTDRGDAGVIGGIASEFFDRTEEFEGVAGGRWAFRPSTATSVFSDMLADAGVTVVVGHRLASSGVSMAGGRITEVRTTTGVTLGADVYVDASYEGDLMAQAGVPFRVGREAQTEFGESRAGVRPAAVVMTVPPGRQLGFPLSAPGAVGSGDHRIQGSNFRACLSTDPDNSVPFEAPDGYDPSRYEVVVDYIRQRIDAGQTPHREWVINVEPLGDEKWDLNEVGALSLGLPGANYDYPDGSWTRRAEIEQAHRVYQKGFLYFLGHDTRIPSVIRNDVARFGLCADEFTDNGHWPRMLYLREGRRMVGQYVVTQHDVTALISKPDTIGLASYRLDVHNVSRWLSADRRLLVEGGLGHSVGGRWSIPYRSIVPSDVDATNLLVPVAASASHVAQASLRMEPQYMIMGQAAGTAAALAVARGIAVQDVPVSELQAHLRGAGAVLDDPGDFAHSFHDAVVWAYHEGITSGCAKGHFCPNSPLPRDQMAALLARALDLPETPEDFFRDDDGNSHEGYINRVAAAGITFGCASNRYCPDTVVTRGQMASFLVRAFQLAHTDVDFFTDDDTSTHQVSINALAASGIANGCTATMFCPTSSVTRGQTFAFLYRHYDGGPSGGWTPPDLAREPGQDSPSPSPSPSPAAPSPSDNEPIPGPSP